MKKITTHIDLSKNASKNEKKISMSRKYKEIRGFTCIAKLKRDLSIISYFMEKSTLGKYYKPLVPESLHMTIFPIDQENVNESDFKRMRRDIDTLKESLIMVPHNMYCNTVLGFDVHAQNFDVGNSLRKIREKWEKKGKHPFHITLGYKYREINPLDEKRVRRDLKILKTIIEELGSVELHKPDIHRYRSMEAFVPYKN